MGSLVIKKYHGLGNDYLVIDPNKNNVELKTRQIKKLCKRNFGIGADGILFGPILEDGKMKVQCFNPDGSEAAKSGTGVRIFGKYLKEEGYVTGNQAVFSTISGEVLVEFLNEEATLVRAEMGKADFHATKIPVSGVEREVIEEPMEFNGTIYPVTCLSVGNPHCAIFTEEVTRKKVMEIGPYVESAPCFPDRINCMLVEVQDRNKIRIEVYERGAGYTLASGTGACAAAAVAHRLGMVDQKVVVAMPGGELTIELTQDETIIMTGTVEAVGMMMITENFFL
ncbi:MAG: diaminopimelate epimerase [Lachnospiraceae bacterium]